MKIIQALITSEGAEPHFLHIGGNTYIVMFLPYFPNEAEASEIFIDNYYPCYQSIRAIKNRVLAELKDRGFEIFDNEYFYKELALMTGAVKKLKNTLTAHPLFGSFFSIEVIKIKGDFGANEAVEPKDFEVCAVCNQCIAACPTEAIGERFFKNRCLREQQSKGFNNYTDAAKCGNKIWGCNICQLVCPANKNLPRKNFADTSLLLRRALFESALNGRKGMAPYAELMGDNYARPNKMTALVINAITNAKDHTFFDEINALASSADERIKCAAARYTDTVTNSKHTEREVKFLICREEYEKAAASTVAAIQINYYFASSACSGEYTLRIRKKEDKTELTLKILQSHTSDTLISDEYNSDIDSLTAACYIGEGISAATLTNIFGVHIPEEMQFEYIGSLTTERSKINAGEFSIELDKNDYLGITDYEAECECDTLEKAESARNYLVNNFKVAKASPKIKRFMDRLDFLNKTGGSCVGEPNS